MARFDDGGSAFPFDTQAHGAVGGMSLRDYFAAAALPGIIAAAWHPEMGVDWRSSAQERAFVAYEHADAMLAARAK